MIQVLVGLGVAAAVSFAVVAAAVVALRPRGGGKVKVAGFVAETARLLRALHRDQDLPRRARWKLRVAFLYDIQPFNLIPDFIPVIGFADNVAITLWAIRSAVRAAGPEAVARHWQGSPEQLELLFRLARLAPPGDEA